MNFGRGFPIPQENGIVQNRDSWTPVTPGKPISRRSNMIPVDMQGNEVGRGDWQELVGVYSTLLQDAPDFGAAVQNSNPTVALGQIGESRNANVGMVPNGGIRNGYVGMVQNGGIRDGNVGIGQNGGIQNCLMNTGQNGGNQSLGMGQNGRIQNRNVGMGQNEGNQNSNVGMGQNGGNHNCNVGASQGNPSYIRYASSSTGTVYNKPANWSDGLLAGLLEAQKKAESLAAVNGAPHKSFLVQNSSSQVGSNWTGSKSRMLRKQGQTFSSSQDVRKYDLPQLPIDGFPVPYRPYYDLNSPPRSEVDATSSIANFFQFAPVTPDKGKLLENHQVPQGVNYSVNGSSSEERDGQEQLVVSMRSEANKNYCNVPITPGKGKLLEHHQVPQGVNYSAFGSSSQERDGQDQLVVSMRSENTENHCNAPVTPDKGKLLENHQVPQGVNYLVHGSSSQERDGQEQLVVSMRSEDNDNHCNELLQTIVNLSSSAVSTALREHNVFDEGDEQGIDLNKTPQQKTPKRRKHRPKVIREGKPKRTPKPKAPENGISNETPSGKRKYVRKNGLKITEAQQPNDVGQVSAEGPQEVRKRKYVRKKSLNIPETLQENAVDEVTLPAGDPVTKSCRRALSFDLESVQGDENQDNTCCNQIERNQESNGGFNLNFNPQDTEPCTGINSISQASAVHTEQQNGYIAGTSNLQSSTYQALLGNSLSPEASAPTTPLANIKAQALNAIARSMTMRNSIPGQKAQLNGYTQVDRHASREGLGQIFYKADAAYTNLDRAREPMLQSTSQLFMKDKPNVEDKRGLKRQSFEQIHPHALNAMNSPFMYQKMLREAIESSNSDRFDSSCLETTKKKKTQDGFYPNISTSLSGITAVKDSPRQEERGMNGVHAKSSNPQVLSSYFGTDNISDNVTNTVNVTTGNSFFHPKAAKQNLQKCHVGSELQPYSERMAIKRFQGSSQVHDFNSLTAMVTWNQLPTTPPKDGDRPDYGQELRTRRANGLGQQQTLNPSPYGQQLNGTDQIDQGQHNNAFEVHQHLPTTPTKGPRSDYLQEIRTCQANVLEQKQVPKPSSTNQRGTDKMLQLQHNNAVEGHQPPKPSSTNQRGTDKMLQLQHINAVEGQQPFSTKARGTPRKQKFLVSVDEITYRLEGLNISGDNKEQHALVIFKGDNSIVPFEPKKRKPRPKVDLDPETDRLWKLLMGKEGSESAEAMDRDKEKWWEEEREVFRGRADSFIARMHLVQGDRRFSRWKGSVVDSVIGVFLTQNVSDHLSSSAFMSLAAKFPPESTIINEACSQNGTQVLVEEPNIQILEHNGSIKHHERIGRHPLYKHSSIVACESIEDKRHFTLGLSDAANEHNRIAEEELISQDSFDSSVFQTADEQRSSSGSNSEAEDQTTGWKPSKNPGTTFMNLLHPEKGNMFEGFYSHVNRSTLLEEGTTHMHHQSENQECYRQDPRFIGGNNLKSSSRFTSSINSSIHHMQETFGSSSHFQLKTNPDSQKLRVQYGGMSAEESLSSFPSNASGVTEVYHTNNQTYQQSNMRIPQAPTFVKYGFLSKHHTHQRSFPPGHQIGNSQNSLNYQQQISETHQLERVFVKEPVGPAETLAKKETDTRKQGSDNTKFRGANVNTEDRMSVVDKQNCFENAAAEANSKERTYSSHEPLGAGATNNVKTKKGKAEDEKRAFDWDSLRKQVLLNGEKRERSKDAVDSLNYEALRSADVSKISDAIRERGMNNMLAERIKDFLNRLVRDHERIDLEWLRDVPPDKAKDYLLSIRGLGLKSVECVRLLTLHHLAFPVDTNVGRIAVRLGWVPLQPLPESLQLHLLELYPVLESIQKYLWPRLCKLDQPTLYELHYQMITFGKVFCTKSKPNCNACPMRAECRHFASAFASARLALPGPEEKSIVSSAIPIVDNRKPKEAIRPLSLPPAENNLHKDAGFFERNCEPIVEEPSTPQSETTEISERDIEDAFYEDPDEIPTIKLNMEEFTTNLQNLMQDNMELQGDMSKALVALNPEAASIPTQKLKNVSRLRTEHQVYELPDSHPLLDGLDKREPDDPSPYLLAIWTPGETANSVQPPDSTCWAQESGNLCNDKTCFSCNSTREANSQTVRGTLLVPCRTAMRGSFPLNGTYFQVNEMFADHESSLKPIDVPRAWLWNLPRRTVFFGTSVSTIFKGLRTDEIQFCFWRGFVCVRGFDQKSRAPRPLIARLHFPASKLVKKKDEGK